MAKAIKVGDRVTLPSGLQVQVTVAAVRDRPWAPLETGHLWHVCRLHGLAAASASFYFGGKPFPLQLDEADAKALASALNRAR